MLVRFLCRLLLFLSAIVYSFFYVIAINLDFIFYLFYSGYDLNDSLSDALEDSFAYLMGPIHEKSKFVKRKHVAV